MRWSKAGMTSCWALLLALGLAAVGCSGEVTQDAVPEDPAGDPVLLQYNALKAAGKDPIPPEILLGKLTATVLHAGYAPDEAAAVAYVIDHYPLQEVGTAVTDAYLNRLLSKGEEQAVAYSRNLIRTLGDTPPAACAFDFLLTRLQKSSRDEFLRTCEEALQGNQERLKCVALLSRINFYHENGSFKLAAWDALRFQQLYPKKVEVVRLQPLFSAVLERAGWLLEADIMNHTSRPSDDAALIMNTLGAGGVELALKSGIANTVVQALFLQAPNITEILQKMDDASLSKEDRCTILLHCSRCELGTTGNNDELSLINRYLEVAEAILAENKTDVSQLRMYNAAMAYAVFQYIYVNGQSRSLSMNLSVSKRIHELAEVLARLAELQVRLCQDQLALGKTERYGIEGVSLFLEEIDQPWVNAAMIEAFIKANAHVDNLLPLQIKLGELQRDKLKQPQKAVQTFLQVFHAAPSSAEGTRAALLAAVLLVQNERHEDALAPLQELEVALSKQDPNYPLVLYYMAICEHSLGFEEDAEVRINNLSITYPQHNVVPKAILWMGAAQLAEQQYDKARKCFELLIERYPQAQEAQRARDYIDSSPQLSEYKP